jgi:membrane dipeptidase
MANAKSASGAATAEPKPGSREKRSGKLAAGVEDAAHRHALELMDAHPFIDSHNDLPWVVRASGDLDLARYDLTRVHAETDTDIPRLRAGKVATQNFAAYLPTLSPNPATVTAEQIDLILRMEDLYADVFHPVREPADVAKARKLGKIGSFVSVEGTVGLEGSLAPLRLWQRLGVRLVTLCHNETLPWVDSATDKPDDQHGGLSDFGRNLISEMNRLGIVIDLAHVAPHAMHKVFDASSAPVMITHSNATALCNHARNTPDDVLARIPKNGGMIMATFVPEFLNQASLDAVRHFKDRWGKNKPGLTGSDYLNARAACLKGWNQDGVAYLCDHLEHFRSLVGEDHIGIGSDFYGGPNPPGLEDASKFPYVIAELIRRGWSDKALVKLMGGNFLRVWADALAAADVA